MCAIKRTSVPADPQRTAEQKARLLADQLTVIRMLVDAKADLAPVWKQRSFGEDGLTSKHPLKAAIQSGRVEVVQLLLALSADAQSAFDERGLNFVVPDVAASTECLRVVLDHRNKVCEHVSCLSVTRLHSTRKTASRYCMMQFFLSSGRRQPR